MLQRRETAVDISLVHLGVGSLHHQDTVVPLRIHLDHGHTGGLVTAHHPPGIHSGALQAFHQKVSIGILSHSPQHDSFGAKFSKGTGLIGAFSPGDQGEIFYQQGFSCLRTLGHGHHKVQIQAAYHRDLLHIPFSFFFGLPGELFHQILQQGVPVDIIDVFHGMPVLPDAVVMVVLGNQGGDDLICHQIFP